MLHFKTNDDCKIYYETHGFESRPLKNGNFCSSSRKAKISTTGIYRIFRGLKFEPYAEIGQKVSFCKGLESSKPVVVFLNGTMQTTFNWRPHARVFKDSFSVILYDARAQGQSELGKKKLSLDLHVQDLSELLHHLKIKKSHFVGLSHGAYVSLSLAFQLPQVVDRLVLCSVGARITDQAKIIIQSWLEILQWSGLRSLAWAVLPIVFGEVFLKQNKRIIDKMVEAIVLRNNKDALIAQLKAINNYSAPGSLAKKINCPALVISGSQDQLVNPKEASQLADLCKARHEEIPEIGHSIPAEAPELFNRTVLKFLTQH